VTGTEKAHDARGWANVLAEVPLFAGLGRRHLNRVAKVATIKRFHRNTAIVRAGEPGDALYVVLDGSIAVRRGGLRDVELGVGSFFGEMALLDDGPRSANVIAKTDATCLRIARTRFTSLLRTEPEIALRLLREVSARLRAAQSTN
jgi:CRP/FNR family transcriptional regulator, cyclic AMP receptor protein